VAGHLTSGLGRRLGEDDGSCGERDLRGAFQAGNGRTGVWTTTDRGRGPPVLEKEANRTPEEADISVLSFSKT